MKNVVVNGYIYENMYRFNDYILKFSSNSVDAWNMLCEKKLSFLNIPDYYYSISSDDAKNSLFFSKVYLPFLYGYTTLYDFNYNFSDEKILLLMRKMLVSLKKMHESDVYHGDIFSKNIMVNDSMDFSFIDLDACIVDDIVSIENSYYDDDISIDCKKSKTVIDDKLGIFNLFLYYFANGNFKVCVNGMDCSRLGFSRGLLDEVKAYCNGLVPSDNYYFLDIVDELIDKGYCFTK